MIRETELNLFVPSPELLVRLASGDRPLGIRAGPPRIKSLRETFFDTPDQTLRRRGMTCKLRQVEGEDPSVVVTMGEGPDSEGITSRSRLTAAAIGAGVFETLLGDSEPAEQVQKFVDPSKLRPQIALDIQRLGRVFRGGFLLKPVLLLFFDRITVQVGGASTVFHELRVRRTRAGGPLIRDIARELRDQHHLFPDGLSTLQRAYRVLAVEGKTREQGLSPYGLSLALALFRDGCMGLVRKGEELHIPTFRGSGEDAARALSADLTGNHDLPLDRIGTTEPREGRVVVELWTTPENALSEEDTKAKTRLIWMPWPHLLEEVGRRDLADPTLISTLLLLSRKQLQGRIPWPGDGSRDEGWRRATPAPSPADPPSENADELNRIQGLLPLLRDAEDPDQELRTRLGAASRLSEELDKIFYQDVTRKKGSILSGIQGEGEEAPIQLVDLMSIRIRGILHRLHGCLQEDLQSRLEEAGIHLRSWSGLMHADRLALLDLLSREHLPTMQVAPEWGPSFIPEMPSAGCAVGILSRSPAVERTRFFHMVLRRGSPSFLAVPGSTTVVPVEEVIRGYFLHQLPELEQADNHMFRFTTGSATVWEPAPPPAPPPEPAILPDTQGDQVPLDAPEGSDPEGFSAPEEPPPIPVPPAVRETRQSVVVRILVHRTMPEGYQAQLLRALERQVSRKNPLIGWSDMFPVTGPLSLTGLEKLLELKGE